VNHRNAKLLFTVSVLPIIGFAMTSAAQEARGLEEIVITASKREQTIQEAGMSVTAISSLELERMGANTFSDFAVRVPNLGFGGESDGRFNANSPAIRGVFGENTTGFYIDDTPVPMSMQPRVIDVERIEVLRGPQGSLYGARSMGGTIRLITKQPDFDGVHGSVHGIVSTVKEGDINWSLDASANLPVVEDRLAVRMTAYYGENSGIFDRVYDPSWVNAVTGDVVQNTGPAFERQKNVDDESYGGFQIVAKAQITENLSFTPKFMYQKIDADGMPFADISPDNFTQERFFNIEEPGMDRWYLANGTFNWDIDAGSIVSTTSYFDRFIDEREEETTFLHFLFNNVIGIPIDPVESPIDESKDFRSIVHETRFTSDFTGRFQLTAGVFYQEVKTKLRYFPPALAPGMNDAVNAAAGAQIDFVPGDLIFTRFDRFNTEEYAAFGELTFDITERVSITAGGRVYKTKTHTFTEADGFANDGYSRVPEDPAQDFVDQSESGFNPKVLLQVNLNEDMDVYASATKGFRIGGSNGNLPLGLCGAELAALNINPADVRTYDSDTLWSYEAGMKSSLADNLVSLNVAGYLIKWDEIAQQNRLACGFQFIDNAGKAEIKGFEVELSAAPVDGLTVTAALGYAHAEITDTGGVQGVTVGDKIQGVPNWTGTVSAQYLFPMARSMDGFLRADYNYYGRSYSANNEASAQSQRLRPSWNALNLRAGVIRDTWELAVFADNVTNTHANLADSRSIAAETPGRPRLITNRPRTIGLDVRKRF